ncbi:MAG TPA: UDP-glucose/GDP-mannose dehydrogenase family protein, partial [Bacillota bacterium]|nr:UDP-glucose/GDP-mannose dehydrogenase family protein [Bacillota bacterium]
LAFKQNSDDIRESPAIRLVKLLSEKEAVIYAADPMATEKARKALEGYRGICFLEGYKKTAISFDAAVLMTPWQEYLDFLNEGSSASLKTALLFDGCRALDKYKFNGSGIKYMGVGIS